MTVTEAIHRAVPVFVAHPDADVYLVRTKLVEAGISIKMAADIVEFLPIAVARAVMEGMGIRFSDEYVRQTAQGRVIEHKNLADEPVFREGLAVAGELSAYGDEMFQALVRRSPEYRAVSQALEAGSRPEELICAPPTMIANEDDRRSFGASSSGKSWWQFWK